MYDKIILAPSLEHGFAEQAYTDAKRMLATRVNGVANVKPVILKGHSSRTITAYAAEIGADAIIVGSHKPGLRDYFLGTTAARIVRQASCAVIVLR